MKVTKIGQKPADRIWLGTCGACGSEAEAVESELTNISHDQRDGSFSWETCPVCSSGGVDRHGGMLFSPKK